MKKPIINIGDLIRAGNGSFGIITKFDKKDNLYTISWPNTEPQHHCTHIYNKNTIEHLLKKGNWKHILNKGKHNE